MANDQARAARRAPRAPRRLSLPHTSASSTAQFHGHPSPAVTSAAIPGQTLPSVLRRCLQDPRSRRPAPPDSRRSPRTRGARRSAHRRVRSAGPVGAGARRPHVTVVLRPERPGRAACGVQRLHETVRARRRAPLDLARTEDRPWPCGAPAGRDPRDRRRRAGHAGSRRASQARQDGTDEGPFGRPVDALDRLHGFERDQRQDLPRRAAR